MLRDFYFREAFKIFDRRRNGFITLKELRTVTAMLGASLSQDELEEFMQEADMVRLSLKNISTVFFLTGW